MGDSDDSYDFSGLGPFVEKLRYGNELVMGNRFPAAVSPKAPCPGITIYRQPGADRDPESFLPQPIATPIAACVASAKIPMNGSA